MYPDADGGTAVGGVCWTAEHALHGFFGQRWLSMRTENNWLVPGGIAVALATAVPAMTPTATRRPG
jgi:hypothetical protein